MTKSQQPLTAVTRGEEAQVPLSLRLAFLADLLTVAGSRW